MVLKDYLEKQARMAGNHKQPLTWIHPRWKEFVGQITDGVEAGGCKNNFTLAESILKRYYRGVHMDKTIEWLRDQGVFCDCELARLEPPLPVNGESVEK